MSDEALFTNRGYPLIPVTERFWNKVWQGFDPGCWYWSGARKRPEGYGLFNFRGKLRYSHRIAYELIKGPIPDGLCVLHHYDNPPCVNPNHLFLGTHSDNQRDAVKKGRASTQRTGEKHNGSKLTWAEVREIRAAWVPYKVTLKMLGAKYKVNPATIGYIVQGKTWKEKSEP